VREWRRDEAGRGVVVVNTTFRMAPWADALYAGDVEWWRRYLDEVARTFDGRNYTVSPVKGPERLVLYHGGNSGIGAISLAQRFGARRIVLLGYDCKYGVDGKRHWHGDHPPGLGNAVSVTKWPEQFREAAQRWRGIEIVNASRDTALTVWPRAPLEEALGYGVSGR